jgi:acyl-CoA thioester hydrolase
MPNDPDIGLHHYHTRVEPEWLDYNGHMNVAYYTLVFDKAGEQFVASVGLSEAQTRESGNSWMVTEAHITYQNEAMPGDELEVKSQILALDTKRLHLFQSMYRTSNTTLLATNEQLILHVNLKLRKVLPFAPEVMTNLQRLCALHNRLEPPPEAGRSIDISSRRRST